MRVYLDSTYGAYTTYQDEGEEDDGGGAAPYIYGAGSDSSCASVNGSSSSGGGGGFDSDSDVEQYSRRVVEVMPEDEDGLSGADLGVAGFGGRSLPTTVGGLEEANSTFHAGLGSAGVFAWGPKP